MSTPRWCALALVPLVAASAACALFASNNLEQCAVDSDCPSGYVCAQGLCQATNSLPDAGTIDRAFAEGPHPDTSARDANRGDARRDDAPRNDANRGDANRGDGNRADASGDHPGPVESGSVEGGAVDRITDVGLADIGATDQLSGDLVVADRALCGNGNIDLGEECDGQDGCEPGVCLASAGFACQPNYVGVICYRTFPAGRPTLPANLDISPGSIYDLNCSDQSVDTDVNSGTTALCGVSIPTVDMQQADGPALRIYRARNLVLSGSLRFRGTRVPVIVAYGDVDIRPGATINVGAQATTPGPGGNLNCYQVEGVSGLPGYGTAGGGGSGAGNASGGGSGGGASGGDGGWTSAGVPGGGSRQSTSGLVGGCNGGDGAINVDHGGMQAIGGAGGGAIQISVAGRLAIEGTIYADGAGGEGGPTLVMGGGAGGGSGGMVLVEAGSLDVWQNWAIVSGGGGGGGAISGADGLPGEAGRFGGYGGLGASGSGGAGGTGATTTGSAGSGGGNGDLSSAAGSGGGGGGGGYGQVVTTTF